MESRILLYGIEARAKLRRGMDALANMVRITLGPKGRNVIIDKKFGSPLITKDGVAVAREVFLKDPIENMGAQLLKEAASKTAEVAGDGTTTATVLAQAIIQEGIKNIAAGANPMDLKRGIDIATKKVVEGLSKISKSIETKDEIVQIGTISANNDIEIGQLIADAMEKVGNEGIITVEDAKGINTFLEVVEGMEFDRGYLSPYFITNIDSMTSVLSDVKILLCDRKITNIQDILSLLELISREGKSMLIIADDVDGDALKTLVYNKVKSILKVCAVKAPGFGDRRRDVLEDIAVLTSGIVASEEVGINLRNITLKDLGSAEKVIVSKDKTVIVKGAGDAEKVEERAEQIKTLIENCTQDFDKEKLQERLAKLAGGVGILRIGAVTESELKEKKMRIEDALHATRAAVDEGIVPGGGVALVRTLEFIKDLTSSNVDQEIGINIVRKSITEPLKAIVENSGVSGEVVLNSVLWGRYIPEETPDGGLVFIRDSERLIDYGYNVQTNKYENFYETGVIDPTKVVRIALESAASIAGLFLTTEGCIAESIEEKIEHEKLMNREPLY